MLDEYISYMKITHVDFLATMSPDFLLYYQSSSVTKKRAVSIMPTSTVSPLSIFLLWNIAGIVSIHGKSQFICWYLIVYSLFSLFKLSA